MGMHASPSAYFKPPLNGVSPNITRNRSFPQCASILWDKRSVGIELESSFSCFREISLSLVERALRLAYSSASNHFRSSKDPMLKGLFLGSLSSHDSDDEIKIVVNRFDPGLHVQATRESAHWPLPSSQLPDDIIVPVLMVKKSTASDVTNLINDVIAKSVKAIEESLTGVVESMNLLKLFQCLCVCHYTDLFGELCFEISCHMIAPSVSFTLKPVNPVPVIPTALARNLSGPLNLAALHNRAKHGFLTMDQTRKLLLLLESDPKVSNLPLVGVWVSGVTSSCDVNVWASLARYQRSNALCNKQSDGFNGFLLMCYLSTERNPVFFDCAEIATPNAYKVFQAQEELNLFKEPSSKADSTFIYFPLSVAEVSPIHQVVDVALRTISSSTRILDSDGVPVQIGKSVSSIGPCSPIVESVPFPQSAPVPHSAHHITSADSVPEVSLWEPRNACPNQINKSDSLEQDHGFFSKSSSDHDSSLDPMHAYPSRHILREPLDPIESSTNVTERSSSNRPSARNDHDSDHCRNVETEVFATFQLPPKSVAGSECVSCRSDKHELNLSLEQQRKQLELLQNQIQTLLRAQNISLPEHINRTVSTRSAQTSPTESTNVSVAMDATHQHLAELQNEVASVSVASNQRWAPDEDMWASIDPNSVPLQEDSMSQDEPLFSQVYMPSLVESEFENTTAESEGPCCDTNQSRMTCSSEQNEDAFVVNCLNSVVLEDATNRRSIDNCQQWKLKQIERLNEQIAKALTINATKLNQTKPEAPAVKGVKGVDKCGDGGREKMSRDSQQHVVSPVDLSMAANAIAMKYQQSQFETNVDTDQEHWMLSSGSFMYQYSYLPPMPVKSRRVPDSNALMQDSRFFDERSTNLSFATEQYLAKHGIISQKRESEDSSQVLPTYGEISEKRRRTSMPARSIQAPQTHSKPHDSSVPNRQKTYGKSKVLDEDGENDSSDSDSESFNILDMKKLRSLPKLL